MGKYKVETDKGTYLVETEDAPAAALPGPPTPPLPAGLQGPPAPNYVQQMKDKLQADRDAQSAAMAPSFNLGQQGDQFGVPVPIGLPINGLMSAGWKKLDDLWAGIHTRLTHGDDPVQRSLANVAIRKGGTQAAKLAAVQVIDKLTGARGGEMGLDLMLGNDMPGATAGARVGGKVTSAVLPKLASSLGPTTQLMDNGDKVVSPATRPGLAALLHGLATQAGANVGAVADQGHAIDPMANVIMGLLNLGGAGATGWQRGVQQTPSFSSEQLVNALEGKTGAPRSGKFTPPVATQFSGLGDTPAIGGFGGGGAATMAPTWPTLPTMQNVMDGMRDIAGTTAKGVKAAIHAPLPTSAAVAGNPALGATLAESVNKPKLPKAVQPADVAQPEPPKKNDKIDKDEASRPVVAGPGGQPVPPAGPGALPGDVPPAPDVAPPDAKGGRAYGRASSVSIPETETRYPVRYRLRELDDLVASHDERSFNYNPKYPHENERDYSLDVNQPRVIENSKPGKFEHERVINDSPEATSGPPITDEHGNVMGGNNRTMMMKRAFTDQKTADAYRALLREKAAQFGLDPAELDKMRRPVLVREMDPGAVTKDNAQDVIADYNVDPSARKSLEEQAMSDAKRLKPEHWDHMGRIIEEMPEGETMRGILGDPRRGPGIVHYLTETGVFKKNELAKLLTDEGAVTAEAKDRIENMLVGRMFRDARQMVNTPAEVKQKLIGIAGTTARLRNYPEWDITHHLPEAISALEHGRVNGFANLGDMNKQMDLNGNTANYDDTTLAIADALKKRGPKVFANKLKTYLGHAEVANGAQSANMFEEPKSLEQAFSEAFDAPRGLKPGPRPARAQAQAAPAEEPAAAPTQAPPAGPPTPPVEPPNHDRVAAVLHKALERKTNGGGKVADMMRPGFFAGEQAAPIRELVDAARDIPESDFQLLFKRRFARAKGRDVSPANSEPVADALKRLGERFGYSPDEAAAFADSLANLHHKISGPGGPIADWSEGRAHAIPFKDSLDKLAAATQEAPAAPAPVAPAPPPAAAPPAPEAKAPPAAKPDAKARSVEDWESFIRGGFGGGTRHGTTSASGTPVAAQLPGAAGRLGTAGFEPGVQRAVASESKAATSELANSTQSPAARAGDPVPPPARKPPVATEKLGTAGYDPQAQLAEESSFQADAAARRAAQNDFQRWTGGTVGTRDGRVSGQPLPADAERQGTAAYDKRPYAANPGKTQKQLDAEAAVRKTADAKAAKVAAKPKPADPLASREAAVAHLTDFLGTLWDRTTGSFAPKSSNKLADYLKKYKAVADLATDGSSQGLQTMMDNVDAQWSKVTPQHGAEAPLRSRFSLPIGKWLGLPARVNLDAPNPMARRRAAAMQPNTGAAETLRYLAKNPGTPGAYVRTALQSIFAAPPLKGDAKK